MTIQQRDRPSHIRRGDNPCYSDTPGDWKTPNAIPLTSNHGYPTVPQLVIVIWHFCQRISCYTTPDNQPAMRGRTVYYRDPREWCDSNSMRLPNSSWSSSNTNDTIARCHSTSRPLYPWHVVYRKLKLPNTLDLTHSPYAKVDSPGPPFQSFVVR